MTGTDFVTIPRTEFDRLVALAEDAEDRAALAAFEVSGQAARAPVLDETQLDRLLAGESPLRVWREALGLSAAELARRSGVNRV